MGLLKSFLDLFGAAAPCPEYSKATHIKHSGRQARAIAHTVIHGQITLADIGGNHPAKVVERLRKQGYLFRHGAKNGERWETNKKTGCDFKVYLHTGKIPPNWVPTAGHTGMDRRKESRIKPTKA